MRDDRVRVLTIASSLCFGGAEKHTVTVFNKLDPQLFACSLAYLKPDESLLPHVDAAKRSEVLFLDVKRKFDRRAVKRLADYYLSHDIDVVLCTNEYPTLYALAAATRIPRPPKLVEVFHTTLYRTAKEKVQMLLYRHIFRRLDLLVYVSSRQREFWRSRGLRAEREVVIQNGIDPEFFRDTYSTEDKARLREQLGFVTRDYVAAICAALRPEKAHIDFLRALAKVKNQGIAIRGLLIGDGVERTNIERAITELNLQDSVVITGFQSDVRPYLAISDVVALTSHAIETFSVAALEAMAMGKPLILTHIGGADEQVEHGVNGYLFQPGDIQALATHLTALADEPMRKSMGQTALQYVRQRFSERRMMDSFSEQIIALGKERIGSTSC